MTTINDPLVGTVYDGRYRIERRIGAGGMANVYLAEDETLGRRVAIKVLHQRYAEDSQFIERFLREASAAARLNHPNIVQVYDRGQAEQTYYIAMEYVDGMTLKDLVKRRGGLTEQEVLAYGRQALHALRFAHRNGIVHRDVKPHNMMVDTDGRLKIADFGIARAGADSGLTEAGSIVGTAQYLSPEQAQGHDVSATSDLYSLGVVMYEMATGGVPFDGESPVNVALQHVKDPVPRPSGRKPGISPGLESIILKAMEKDPARRYSTADEMLADLDRAREGGTTQAMTQVMPGAAAAAFGVGATQVTPITPVAQRQVPARVYEQPVPPEPAWPESGWDDEDDTRRGSAWKWLLPLLVVLALAGAAAYFLLAGGGGDPVPDVTGKTVAQAQALLEAEGFALGSTDEAFDPTVPAGRIIEQDPGADEEAEQGSEIDVVVSKGVEPTQVPNVIGKPSKEARAEITKAGFKPVLGTAEFSDTVKKGYVIRQDPDANQEAQQGTEVILVLSKGEETQTVPNVVGMDFAAAEAKLTADPFNYTVRRDDVDAPQPEGTVVKQTTGELAPGEQVTLQVATGRYAIPDVEGLGAEQAQSRLAENGFENVDVTPQVTDDATQWGVVQSVDPGVGEVVDLTTQVTLTVGEAPADAASPTPDNPGLHLGSRKRLFR